MDCKDQHGVHRNCADSSRQSQEHFGEKQPFDASLNVHEIVGLLRSHSRLWIIPAVVCTVIAGAFSFVATRNWRATQALIVRPEAASVSDDRLGKFSDLSEMKTLQETILELAKSHGAIEATLKQLGPANGSVSGWPNARDIEDFRDHIDMRPPGGAEFGKTEVFYLSVLDTDRVRASRALAILCDVLEKRLQELRDQRAQGMIAELKKAADLAEADLTDRTQQLAAFEANIGADLVELRNLNATVGGQGEVSQQLQAIDTERRANEAIRRENVRLLSLLESAGDEPQKLLATPNSLLHSQPAVNRLKNALVDAQIRTSGLLGSRSEKHPFVAAARAAEDAIREQLHGEIGVAIEGLKIELAMNGDREEALVKKWLEARERISRLAESRADYANLVSAAENYTRLVEGARKNLADARARQAAALSASVIGRIDGVEAGVRPDGPGRKTITAGGGVAGLILGFGLVFLFASPGRNTANPPASATTERSPTERQVFLNERLNTRTAQEQFGLFKGMTLEEAIRSVEGAVSQRRV
jgi:polysaccharide biosynthesis transport protein